MASRKPKNQKGPSSSSAAAAFLISKQFNAFDAFASGSLANVPGSTLESSVDSEFKVIFKHLTKKDTTTKLKALGELSALVKDKSSDDIKPVLGEWALVLNKLSLDPDRRVREKTYQVFTTILEVIVKKHLAPHLKSIMGVWLCAINDTEREVRAAAKQAFDTAFARNKQLDAIQFCADEILAHVAENLKQTIQTLSDTKTTPPEVSDEIFNRVIRSSLMALYDVIDALPEAENQKHLSQYTDICDNNPQFWKFFSLKKFGDIRSAMYKIVTVMCKKTPSIIRDQLSKLAPVILSTSFEEKDVKAHANVWEAILTFMKVFPEAFEHINMQKAVLPRFYANIRSDGYGSPQIVFASLLPFVSMLNHKVLGSAATKFFDELFTNLWKSEKSELLMKSYVECLLYAVFNARKFTEDSTGNENTSSAEDEKEFISRLLNVHAMMPIAYYLTSDDMGGNSVADLIATAVQKLHSRESLEEYMPDFWTDLYKVISSTLKSNNATAHERVPQLLKAMYDKFTSNELNNLTRRLFSDAITKAIDDHQAGFVTESANTLRQLSALATNCGGLANMLQPVEGSPTTVTTDEFASHLQHLFELHLVADKAKDSFVFFDPLIELIAQHLALSSHEEASSTFNRMLNAYHEKAPQDTQLLSLLMKKIADSFPFITITNVGSILDSLCNRALNPSEPQQDQHIQLLQYLLTESRHISGALFDATLNKIRDFLQGFASAVDGSEDARADTVSKLIHLVSGVISSPAAAQHHQAIPTLRSIALLIFNLRIYTPEVDASSASIHQEAYLSDTFVEAYKYLTRQHLAIEDASAIVTAAIDVEDEEDLQFRQQTSQLDTSAEMAENVVSSAARATWSQIAPRRIVELFFETGDQSGAFIDSALDNVQQHLANPASDTPHEILLEQVLALEELAVAIATAQTQDESAQRRAFWAKVIMDQKLWARVRKDVDQSVQVTELEYQTFTTPASSSALAAGYQYARFIRFALECLLHSAEQQSDILLTDWLALEMVFAFVIREMFNRETDVAIQSFYTKQFLGVLNKSEFSMTALPSFLSISRTHKNDVYRVCLRTFITNNNQFNRGKDKTTLDLVFSATNKFESVLASRQQTETIEAVVEALLYGEAYVADTGSVGPLYSQSCDWLSQAISILLQYSSGAATGSSGTITNKGELLRISNVFSLLSSLLLILQVVSGGDDGAGANDDSITIEGIVNCVQDFFASPDARSLQATLPSISKFLRRLLDYRAGSDGKTGATIVSLVQQLINTSEQDLCGGKISIGRTPSQTELRDMLLIINNRVELLQTLVSRNAIADTIDSNTIEQQRKMFMQLLRTFLAMVEYELSVQQRKHSDNTISYHVLQPIYLLVLDNLTVALRNFPSASVLSDGDQELQALCDRLYRVLKSSTNLRSLATVFDLLGTIAIRNVTTGSATTTTTEDTADREADAIISTLDSLDKLQQQIRSMEEQKASEIIHPALRNILQSPPIHVKEGNRLSSKFIQNFAHHQSLVDTRNNETFGYLLAWNIFIKMFEAFQQATSSASSSNNNDKRDQLFAYLRENVRAYSALLDILFSYILSPVMTRSSSSSSSTTGGATAVIPIASGPINYNASMSAEIQHADILNPDPVSSVVKLAASASSAQTAGIGGGKALPLADHYSVSLYAAALLYRFASLFPSLLRSWWSQITDRSVTALVEKFVTDKISPLLIDKEMDLIAENAKSLPHHVKVKLGRSSNQVVAVYEKDEIGMEVLLKIAPSYPLRPLTVESSKKLGVSEAQWRKWILKMTTVLANQEGTIWDAISLWRTNLDRHFEGIENCPICYSIVSPSDHSLPNICCTTCKNRFHSSCLYKWFNTSGNNSCPLCRSQYTFMKITAGQHGHHLPKDNTRH